MASESHALTQPIPDQHLLADGSVEISSSPLLSVAEAQKRSVGLKSEQDALQASNLAYQNLELRPEHVDQGVQTKVVVPKWQDKVTFVGLLISLLIPTAVIFYVVLDTWIGNPSQRGWLMLGSGFYVGSAMKLVWSRFAEVYERMLYLRVEIHRLTSPTMFEALTNAIEKEAEKIGLSCSRDHEARQEHERVTGNFSVKLRFWSSSERNLTLLVYTGFTGCDQVSESGASHIMQINVRYDPGESITTGRQNTRERCEILIVTVRCSSDQSLAKKKMLCQWMESCYNDFIQPMDGVVSVYALQESSTDWVPTWALERNKRVKNASGSGHSFYLERDSLQKIHADAELWAARELRVYLIYGPPGVGKSEFTVRLAAQLGLPVYRLCLSSPKLSDDRLAQLLSPSATSHNSMLVQVDEFQQVLQSWVQSKNSHGNAHAGVTPGGFCECLQGSMAMGRGVVVMTGTNEIVAETVKKCFPAVFRRIHFEARLGYMVKAEVAKFFRNFLVRFAPLCSPAEWSCWESSFLDDAGPWAGLRPVSVDMLKQFFMHQITEASCLGMGEFNSSEQADSKEFQVHRAQYDDFFGLICNADMATSFLDHYSPVHCAATALIEPACNGDV